MCCHVCSRICCRGGFLFRIIFPVLRGICVPCGILHGLCIPCGVCIFFRIRMPCSVCISCGICISFVIPRSVFILRCIPWRISVLPGVFRGILLDQHVPLHLFQLLCFRVFVA